MSNFIRSVIAGVITVVVFQLIHSNPDFYLLGLPGLAVLFGLSIAGWFAVYLLLGRVFPPKTPKVNPDP